MTSQVVCPLLTLALILLLAHVVFSWIPRPPEPMMPVVRLVRRIVDPVLSPLRRLVPPLPLGAVALDVSIIIVFVLLSILRNAFHCG